MQGVSREEIVNVNFIVYKTDTYKHTRVKGFVVGKDTIIKIKPFEAKIII